MIKTQKRFRFKNPHYFSVKTYEIKKLDKNLTLFLPHFSKRIPFKNSIVAQKRRNLICKNRTANPYQYFKNKALKKYVILGIGGNLEKCAGDCIMRFWQLLRCLKNKNVIILASAILKNPAFGYTKQPDFYNMIVWLKTRLGFSDFWSYCAYLERIFKRDRKRPFKNAPRTLDLDIIGFKNKRISLKHFKIPHIAWEERNSVRIPLFWSKG
ncbi:MAG: 2-amino-4-hydroxy-6-hydroxymethyldihydropteridine diphosphokinase [Helicobacter sp.]|nr:2-amino-4-hydroxy-6-hydroxymethyldihydropteridine diphosphokinase [Helicobacteraceae bacterium]MDY3112993.1 2-amino-4-hydroxy-6-hydroxymethyldihydropteridine diphosphokinase [Helicobacter sp.]